MTRIFGVLLERDVPMTFFVARVVADFPTETFIAELVREAKLPEKDLMGRPLVYALEKVDSNEMIARRATLLEAGVEAGTRLRLKEISDLSLMLPEQKSGEGERKRPVFSHGSTTIADPQQFGEAVSGSAVQAGAGGEAVASRHVSRRVALGLLVGGALVGSAYGLMHGTVQRLESSLGGMMNYQGTKTLVGSKPTPIVSSPLHVAQTFTRHQARVQTVAWSEDSTMVASGDEAGHVYVWKVDQHVSVGSTRNVLLSITQGVAIHAVRWSLGQKRLAICSGTDLAFYDGMNGNLIVRFAGVHIPEASDMVWVNAPGALAVSVGLDKRALVWNTKQYRVDMIYMQSTDGITAVCATADGKAVYTASLGGIVRVWNPVTGQDLHGYYQDTSRPLRAIACSPLTGQVVAGGDDGVLRLWTGLTCSMDGDQCTDQPQRVTITGVGIQGLTWSSDGRVVAIGCSDGTLALWRPKEAHPFFQQRLGGAISAVSLSPSRQFLATALGNEVMIWKVK